MPWFKKEEVLPERIKGKTPEQVAKELEDADAARIKLEADAAALRAQVDEVNTIKTEFEQVKERLRAAEANPPKPKEPPAKVTGDQIIEDPEKAIGQVTAPLQQITINNSVITARLLAQQQLDNSDMASGGKTMDGRLFRAWQREIDAESTKYNPIQLMKPDAWIGIFFHMKGVHADELANPEIRKKKYNFLEPSTQGAPPPPNNEKKEGAEGLTDAEKHVADKMGVSYDNYAKRKKSMQFVNA